MMRNVGLLIAVVLGAFFVAAEASAQQEVFISHSTYHIRACSSASQIGFARCHAHIVSDNGGRIFVHNVARNAVPSGYSPSNLRSAYAVTGSGSSSTIVAIVDAYGYPNAESDLAVYRSQYGLPACTSANGCFRKYNEKGAMTNYPATDTGWSQETALDLDMVSAMCPNCRIVLVEANSASYQDLATAENVAAALGAHSIGNSYGGCEIGTQGYDSAYMHSGIAITVSTGDSGYNSYQDSPPICGRGSTDGAEFPSTSPYVTAVGGTSLYTASNARGWLETAWADGGSGCSAVYGQSSWQAPVDTFCRNRTVADVSAVADPATGVAVYGPVSAGSSGWMVFGGTSASAQIINGIYGTNGGPVTYGENPYQHTNALNNITSGTNGSCGGSPICTARSGYNGPTGLGTPNGVGAF